MKEDLGPLFLSTSLVSDGDYSFLPTLVDKPGCLVDVLASLFAPGDHDGVVDADFLPVGCPDVVFSSRPGHVAPPSMHRAFAECGRVGGSDLL